MAAGCGRVQALLDYRPGIRVFPEVTSSVCIPSSTPLVVANGQVEFKVEAILDSSKIQNSLQYLIHWKGFRPGKILFVAASSIHADYLIAFIPISLLQKNWDTAL